MQKKKRHPLFFLKYVWFFAIAYILFTLFNIPKVQAEKTKYKAELAKAEAEYLELQTTLFELKNKTTRLSDEQLDMELLDQQIRTVLGYLRDDERIVK